MGQRAVKMVIDFVHTQVEVLQIQWNQTRQRVLLPVESIKERLMLECAAKQNSNKMKCHDDKVVPIKSQTVQY